MAKINSTIYVCNSCGYESPKWLGKCPSCNEWNTFVEEKVIKSASSKKNEIKKAAEVTLLNNIEKKEISRVKSGFAELDRVLRRRICKWFFNTSWRRTRNSESLL